MFYAPNWSLFIFLAIFIVILKSYFPCEITPALVFIMKCEVLNFFSWSSGRSRYVFLSFAKTFLREWWVVRIHITCSCKLCMEYCLHQPVKTQKKILWSFDILLRIWFKVKKDEMVEWICNHLMKLVQLSMRPHFRFMFF